jgi:hypothetical protein
MRRLLFLSLAVLAMTASVARAGSIGIGVFGGESVPVLQDDVDKGTMYGVRVPVKLVPLVSLEPFYASSGLGDKTTTIEGVSYTRSGFDETAYGLNAMLTMGGPVSFYPYAGIGSTKLKRTGAESTFTSYDFGIGVGFHVIPKIELHVRGELQAVVDGDASRKFGNVTLGASYALFSMP